MAFPAGYTKYQEITIDNTKVSADLTDYVVYVDLADLVLAGADVFDTCRSDGGDLRATKSDGATELPIEVVAIDTTAKTGEVHIKISGTTSSSTDTVIRLYYNGTDTAVAVGATYGRNNVWTNGYAAVYHMQETSGSIIDSTGNGHDGTGVSTMPNAIAGKVGGAQDFNGSSYIDTSDDFADGASELTLSCWVNPDNFDLFNAMIMKHHGPTPRAWGFQLQTDGQIAFQLFYSNGSNSSLDSGSSFKAIAASWNYVTGTYDDAANSRAVYLNGTQANTDSPTLGMQNDSSNVTLGAYRNGANKLNGQMDEVRIATAERTSNWITTEYNNQNSPSTFYSSSAEVGGTSSVSFDASPLTATFSIPAYTPQTGTTESVSPLTATFSIVAATTSAGTTQTASPLTATFSIPPNTADLPDYEFSASPLTATFSQPAFTISTSSAYAAAVLSAVFSIPTSVTTGDANTSAGVLSATFTIPVYTLDVVFNIQGAKITPQLTLKRERVILKKY